ncbi:MAG: MBL fold metallo-hydrolase [Bryobacteraceae bacterium]|nr:MBL fold metallo-hydrolase [Bryobacteraceae bacterium]
MTLERFEAPGLAHYSYLIGSDGAAAVIDPQRDFDVYTEFAERRNLRITHILETHIHADFASGATALAAATGAELWLSAHDDGQTYQYAFDHRPFHDGESIRVGYLRLEAFHTQGHTPEHLSFLIYDTRRCGQPMALMSGDFIFCGSIGRPDLLGDDVKRALAYAMFDSLHWRIAALPDYVELHPGHGAGSLCGAAISDRPRSTLGYERACNIFLNDYDRDSFVKHLLETVPEFPDYYRRMKALNAAGPPVLHGLPGGRKLASIPEGALVVDLRKPEAFAGAHVPGSMNLGAGASFGLWAGWLIPPDKPIVLIADSADESVRRALIRVGLDEIAGWMPFDAYIASGAPIESTPLVREPRGTVIDVRAKGEFALDHIEGAVHIPLGSLARDPSQAPPGDVTLVCAGGYRASAAQSILGRGAVLAGGLAAWRRTHSRS